MYKTSCITDGGKRKILKGFPKETIELSEEQPQALVGCQFTFIERCGSQTDLSFT
jgi:hypothetical protein